jgi:membrane fusion protein (multidrug efflux system)
MPAFWTPGTWLETGVAKGKQEERMSDSSPKSNVVRASRKWPQGIVTGAVLLAAIALLAAISQIPASKQDAEATEAPPVNVSVMTVCAETRMPDSFDLPAAVEPNRIVTVAAEVAGSVERLPWREGRTVRAGDVLVQLNTDLIKPQAQIAKAQYDRDKIQYDRITALVKTDAASQADLDDASTRLATSRAQLDEAQARLERSRIISPIGGVLNDLPIEEGEYVQVGTAVAEVVETDPVKVVVQIPERDVSFLSVGQAAEVLVDVRGQPQSMAGTITFISEIADPQTRSTRTEITLGNKEGLLRSGQIVRARLTRRILENAIMVPLLAVIPMEDGKAVYVVESGQAQRRNVKLGIIKGDRVQIVEGLNLGDQLIVAGHRFVAPGQKVKVVAPDREGGSPI